jgi:hypothetical protein
MGGPWEDFTAQASPASSDGPWADFAQPNTTTVEKTSDNAGPALSSSSFKKAPSPGMAIEPHRLDRFLNGIYQSYAGAEQLAAHGAAWAMPETAGPWAKGADRRAQTMEDEGRDLARHAGVKDDSTDWWNVAGQVASPINWAAGEGAVGAARALPWAGRVLEGSGWGANLAKGTVAGAGIGAAAPVTGDAAKDYGDAKLTQTGVGAITGGALAPAANAVGAVISPTVNASARKLLDEGVRLTPGQIVPMLKRVEDVAQSFPFVGGMVRDARAQAMGDFNVAAANRALAPIGEKVAPGVAPGHDLIEHVEDKISSAYQKVHPNISLSIDPDLAHDLGQVTHAAGQTLGEGQQKQLQNTIKAQISDKLAQNGGIAPGEVVQGITSELGNEIRGYRGDPSFDSRKLGQALGDVRTAISDALIRQNPGYADELQKANEAWANYVKIRDAAGRAGNVAGQFSPTQLNRAAVKGETAGTNARGQALMQDLAEAGKEILPSKVPDSGTPERAALMGLMTHGIGHYGAYSLIGPGALVPAAVIAGLYNPIGQRVMRAALTSRPDISPALRRVLDMYAPSDAGQKNAASVIRGASMPADAGAEGLAAKLGQDYVPASSPSTPSRIVTPDGSMEIPAEPKIVELGDLKYASGDLQPRDRNRAEYVQGARDRASRLDPQQLQPGRVSDSGAPIVTPDGTILSGNGRTISISEAYRNPAFKAQADAYRASLGPSAANMKEPVLVMKTGAMEPDAAQRFADLSNRSRTDTMSATERASRDAKALGDDVNLYQGGDFDSPANAAFVRSFIGRAVSPAEMPSISKNGILTQEGVNRMKAALLGSAYDDAPLLSRLLESTDDNVRGITGALVDVAPKIAGLRRGIDAGEVMGSLDPSRDLQSAVKFIADLRSRGLTPRDYFAQTDAFGGSLDKGAENWVRALYNDDLSRQLSRQNIKTVIDAYAEEAAKHKESALFPDSTTSADVLTSARRSAFKDGEAPQFDEPGKPAAQIAPEQPQAAPQAAMPRLPPKPRPLRKPLPGGISSAVEPNPALRTLLQRYAPNVAARAQLISNRN